MIKFLVTGQQLVAVTPAVVVSDTLDYITAKFEFNTDDWDELAKVAYFQAPDSTQEPFHVVLSNDEITKDRHVALSAGNWQIYLIGLESTTSSEERITTSTTIVKVEQALNGSEFPEVNLSVAEQLTAMVAQVKEAADSGEFDGVTFIPSVDDEGNISWTNDKEKENPETKNIRGPQGETGATGQTGATGATGNGIASTVLNADYTLTITFTDGTEYTTTPIRGSQGPKGDTGSGFKVLGYYATLDELKAAHPTADSGDAYGVGTAAPYEIYIYDGTTSSWVDNGTIQGAKGDTGNGISSTVLNADYTLTITFTDGTVYTTPSIRGEQGIQGIQGIQGEVGPQGELGPAGPTGEAGHTPVRGEDYWTDEDKAEVVQDAINGVSPKAIGAIKDPTTKSKGQYLEWNGTAWVAADVEGGVTSVDSKTGAVVTRLIFTNQTIDADAWIEQETPTYEDYPYVASLALDGVTAADVADVILLPADAVTGEFAPVVETYSGGVYLYRSILPDAQITIPTILITKG